jgi:transcriptional regulator with XRE-family HTH domain
MTSFSERLRAVRKRMGMSQVAFAELVGISEGSQGLYERGEVEPSAAYFLKLGELGVDMNFLCQSSYSEGKAAAQFSELLAVLQNLSPAQQAMGFAMLNLLQQGEGNDAENVAVADKTWRVGRLVGQFVAMNEAGKRVVEVAAKCGMDDLPPR